MESLPKPPQAVLDALVAAIEAVDPGGADGLLRLLAREHLAELAHLDCADDPSRLETVMRQLVADTFRVGSQRPMH